MPLKPYIDRIRATWAAWRHSRRTNSIVLYLTCLVISFLFWLFLTLNNETQKDLSLPLRLAAVPDSTTIISGLPDVVKVSVRDKGSSLLRYDFGNEPSMTVDFLECADGNGSLKISSIEMLARVRKLFNNTTAVVAVSPDSLSVKYTNLPGKRVPVKADVKVSAAFGYVINGATMVGDDSVTVYSDRNTLAGVSVVQTRRIADTGLTDTLTQTVGFLPIAGAKVVPAETTVRVPIEPLIAKKQKVNIDVVNLPIGVNVITFPSTVEASFLVPQSIYSKVMNIKAVVNYSDILRLAGTDSASKVAVKIIEVPAECRNISLASDSVEYIVEK